MSANPEIVTAAVLVIGDEILSGRTKDKNIGFIADYLTAIGIDLKEVRVISDDEAAIVTALNALRARYTYVFTTGGIGPTHDDITAECVAKAFGVPIDYHPEAVAILKERMAKIGGELNEARLRMARIPQGAALVKNKVSGAPGFWIENVIVMAGVPSTIACMIDGTPAITITLPIQKPGAPDTLFATRSAPFGMRAMRSRASFSSPPILAMRSLRISTARG